MKTRFRDARREMTMPRGARRKCGEDLVDACILYFLAVGVYIHMSEISDFALLLMMSDGTHEFERCDAYSG